MAQAECPPPQWRFSGPDETGTVYLCWQGESSPNITQLPLGPVDDVAPRLADFLGAVDFGETVPDREGKSAD